VQKEAEQSTTAATIHKLETLIPLIQPRVGSTLTYFETLQLLVEQRGTQRPEKPPARSRGGRGSDRRDEPPSGGGIPTHGFR
jgi:hypothetical protein